MLPRLELLHMCCGLSMSSDVSLAATRLITRMQGCILRFYPSQLTGQTNNSFHSVSREYGFLLPLLLLVNDLGCCPYMSP